jgi:predicted PurR-regulated permease PerM
LPSSDLMKVGHEDRGGAWYKWLGRGAPLAVLVAAGLLIAYEALTALELIVLAMLVAVVLRTIVRGLRTLGAGPWLSGVIILVVLGAFGALVWLVVVPSVVREAQTLISQTPGYIDSLANLARRTSYIPNPSELANQLNSNFSQLLYSLPSLATTAVKVAAEIVAILFLALYMTLNPRPLVSGALLVVPPEGRERAEEFLKALEDRLRGWIVGTILISLFIGVGGSLGL